MSKLNLFNAARRRSGVTRFFSGLAATAILATAAGGLAGCDEEKPSKPASLVSVPNSTSPVTSDTKAGKDAAEKAAAEQAAAEQAAAEQAAAEQAAAEEAARQQQVNSFVNTPQPAESAYYRNCTEARNAGAAPLHRGQPGYREKLDRDHDGVACE